MVNSTAGAGNIIQNIGAISGVIVLLILLFDRLKLSINKANLCFKIIGNEKALIDGKSCRKLTFIILNNGKTTANNILINVDMPSNTTIVKIEDFNSSKRYPTRAISKVDSLSPNTHAVLSIFLCNEPSQISCNVYSENTKHLKIEINHR